MVIDVEAIVLPQERVYILEQIGYVMVDHVGVEFLRGKFFVKQPFTDGELSKQHKVAPGRMKHAINAYEIITCDRYIHTHPHCMDASTAIQRVIDLYRMYDAKAYAKNPTLERQFFEPHVKFDDLELYGCPKYPIRPHDPMLECVFFATYIPEIGDVQNNTDADATTSKTPIAGADPDGVGETTTPTTSMTQVVWKCDVDFTYVQRKPDQDQAKPQRYPLIPLYPCHQRHEYPSKPTMTTTTTMTDAETHQLQPTPHRPKTYMSALCSGVRVSGTKSNISDNA